MLDVQVVKRGAIFFVPDLSGDTSVIFTGEHYPKKCRPWIVVSNDICNAYNHRIQAVPVYTRNKTSLPTHVYFTHDRRDCVACCEQITSFEISHIDSRAYAGTVSDEILGKIEQGLKIQLGLTEPIINTENIIKNLTSQLNLESIISKELVKILINNYMPITTKEEPIKNITSNTDNAVPTEPVNSATTDTPITTNNENNNTTKADTDNWRNKPRKRSTTRRPRGLTMTLDNCIEFCKDAKHMSDEALIDKWKAYGLSDLAPGILAKKKYAIRQRLVQNNVPLP